MSLASRKMIGTIYLHRDKDSGWSDAEEFGIVSEEAQRNHVNSLYEVELKVSVDLDTGSTEILECNGIPLQI